MWFQQHWLLKMPERKFQRGRRKLLTGMASLGAGLFLNTGWTADALANVHHSRQTREPQTWKPSAYELPPDGSRVIGRTHYVSARASDTLLDIARRFDLGYWEIVLANPGVDIWLPGKGTRVLIPRRFILPDTPRKGIVVNIPEMRLYYYPPPATDGTRHVITHPVGIGRRDWSTPLGVTHITDKIPDPAWYPPASIRAAASRKGNKLPAVIPPGPENPLGQYALILDIPGYLIHGTNRPAGVGMRVSHGCMRLYPEDIKSLFARVRRGMPVRMVNEPYSVAWSNGELFLHWQPLPGMDEYTGIDPSRHRALVARLRASVRAAAESAGFLVDEQALRRRLERISGIPESVPLI
jgi:L,D-transpeptidase ErfK/SrfK